MRTGTFVGPHKMCSWGHDWCSHAREMYWGETQPTAKKNVMLINANKKTGKMDQWGELLVVKHDSLNAVPKIHLVEREAHLSCPLTSMCAMADMSPPPHDWACTYMQVYTPHTHAHARTHRCSPRITMWKANRLSSHFPHLIIILHHPHSPLQEWFLWAQ